MLLVLAWHSAFLIPGDLRPRERPKRVRLRSAEEVKEKEVKEVERSFAVQLWGVLGVASYLSYGLKKVVPIVTNGVSAITSPFQWLLLAGSKLAKVKR